MAWLSPTAANDPDGMWQSEDNVYDDDLESYAMNWSWQDPSYLEVSHAAISCSKVRIHVALANTATSMEIGVYYSDGWHPIFSGDLTEEEWLEKEIGSTQTVTAARFKRTSEGQFYVNEFEFWEVEVPAVIGPFPTHFRV